MISADEYKDYVQAPYKVDPDEKIPLPLVNDKNTMIISVDPEVIAKAKNTKTLLSDPRMKEVQKIWPSAPSSTWVVDGDYIRIIKAPYTVSRTETKTSALDISALYKDDLLSDIIIFYGDYTIEVA